MGDVNTFSDMYFLLERGWPLARLFVGVQLGAYACGFDETPRFWKVRHFGSLFSFLKSQ